MTQGDDRGSRRGGRSITAADAIVAVVVVATAAFWFHASRGTWFVFDEWALALRGQSPGDFLEPYNSHLSITYIGIYRLLYGLVGFGNYAVFRLMGILALALVPTLLHITTRARLGPPLAGLAAISVLWFHGTSLEPGGMNHPLTLAAGVVCAWALGRRGRRSDLVLGAALAAALATSGGGVPIAAACGIYTLLSRAPLRRWLAVAVPTGAWLGWWLVAGRSEPRIDPSARLEPAEIAELVGRGHFAAMEGLGFDNPIIAGVLAAGFIAAVVARFRAEGRGAAASVIAWLGASVVWWGGLGYSRGLLADPETTRYGYVCAVYLLLAVIPRDGRTLREATRGWWAPAVLIVVTAVLVSASRGAVESWADRQRLFGDSAHRVAALAVARPPVLEPTRNLGLAFAEITPKELNEARKDYGGLPVPRRGELDEVLVEFNAVDIAVGDRATQDTCERVTEPITVGSEAGASIVLRTTDRPVTVSVRRFGDDPVVVGSLPTRSSAEIALSKDRSSEPWQVFAEGACR